MKSKLNFNQLENARFLIGNYISVKELPATTQKNFYGKAMMFETRCGYVLMSYTTIVCSISFDGSFHKHWDGYSVTTMRHINNFRLLFDMDIINKKQWDNMEYEYFKVIK